MSGGGPPGPPEPAAPRLFGEAWWRERRLSLSGLSRRTRTLALASLVVTGLSGAMIVAFGAGWEIPGGTVQAEIGGGVPSVLVALCYLGLAVAIGTITAATLLPTWSFPRPTRFVLALLGAAIAASTILGVDEFASRLSRSRPAFPLLVGLLGLGAAVALAFGPSRWFRRAAVPVTLAAAPFLCGLLAHLSTPTPFGAMPDPQGVPPGDLVPQGLFNVIGALNVVVAILLLMGLVEAGHQARDLSMGIGGLHSRIPRLLVTAVVAKLVWLFLVYADLLPASFGGALSYYEESRANSFVGWLMAGLFAAAITWWLARPRAPVRGAEPAGLAARLIGLAFTTPFLVAILAALGVQVLLLLPSNGPAQTLLDFVGDVTDPTRNLPLWTVIVVVAAAFAFGLRLARRSGYGVAAAFLLVFSAWAMPRALVLTGRLLAPPEDPSVIRSLSADAVTLDFLVTVGIAVLLVMWHRGIQRQADPRTLLVVLAASTLIAYPDVLLPAVWQQGFLFYLALVYPVAHRFLLNAKSLNTPDPSREARVLGATGLSAVLLLVASVFVALGLRRPEASNALALFLRDLGTIYLLVPVTAFLVASALGPRDGPEAATPSGTEQAGLAPGGA